MYPACSSDYSPLASIAQEIHPWFAQITDHGSSQGPEQRIETLWCLSAPSHCNSRTKIFHPEPLSVFGFQRHPRRESLPKAEDTIRVHTRNAVTKTEYNNSNSPVYTWISWTLYAARFFGPEVSLSKGETLLKIDISILKVLSSFPYSYVYGRRACCLRLRHS